MFLLFGALETIAAVAGFFARSCGTPKNCCGTLSYCVRQER